MTDRVALVTGAARGIGRGILERLARDGFRVVGVDLAEASPGPARMVRADVGDPDAVSAVVAGIEATEGRLDAVVSNAGMMKRAPLDELAPGDWDRVIRTNLTAAFLRARASAPLLRRQGGAIVTIASTRARQSEPETEAYAASKGGLVALTHALAISLGPAIRVNCVSPGWIATKGEALRAEDHAQHPAGRVGTVEDVAGLVAWLIGLEAGFVTGAEFVVDGGMTRKMIYAE